MVILFFSFTLWPHLHAYLCLCLYVLYTQRYVVTTMTLEKDVGIENLNRVIENIRQKLLASEGKLEVKMAPKAVSQRDEADLQVRSCGIFFLWKTYEKIRVTFRFMMIFKHAQAMMKRIEEENEEVDGDAPEDS